MDHDRAGRIIRWLDSELSRDRLRSLAERLRSGATWADLSRDCDVSAREIVAATVLDALSGDGPPLVRGRPGTRVSLEDDSSLFPRSDPTSLLCLSAGISQILDDWDASHSAAQEAEDRGERSLSAYWHAIAHRREPDPGNAAYWLRRVGRHPIHADLATEAIRLIDEQGEDSLASRLLPGGIWDASAFLAFCGEAARRPGSKAEQVARRLQRAEMVVLLDATVDACS